jgi:hypothetical protein
MHSLHLAFLITLSLIGVTAIIRRDQSRMYWPEIAFDSAMLAGRRQSYVFCWKGYPSPILTLTLHSSHDRRDVEDWELVLHRKRWWSPRPVPARFVPSGSCWSALFGVPRVPTGHDYALQIRRVRGCGFRRSYDLSDWFTIFSGAPSDGVAGSYDIDDLVDVDTYVDHDYTPFSEITPLLYDHV